jgi:hypothetical protein
MKTFSAQAWFNRHGANKTTALDVGGLRFRLDGSPSAYTDAALSKLAEGQESSVRISTPRVETAGGVFARSSGNFTAKEVSSLIREYASADKEAAEVPPAVKERAASVGVNGTASS